LLQLALRIVEQMWSVDKQAKNTKEAMSIATRMYNKAYNINKSFEGVKKSFTTAQKNIETASIQIESGDGNFISLINNFKQKLGLITNKQITNKNNDEIEN